MRGRDGGLGRLEQGLRSQQLTPPARALKRSIAIALAPPTTLFRTTRAPGIPSEVYDAGRMFGIGYSSSGTSIDPEVERNPPPPPTIIYFPQNDIPASVFAPDDTWTKHLPDLASSFGHISRPSDIRVSHLKDLNFSEETDVPLEQFIPTSSEGHAYLPPASGALPASRRNSSFVSRPPLGAQGGVKYPLLSNGHKAPDDETYAKYLRELTCENEDGWRRVQNRRPRPGHPVPNIVTMRRFWGQLELIASYWDASLDHYFEAGSEPAEPKSPKSPKGFRRLGLAMHLTDADAHKPKGKRYKGRRTSTGSKMPDTFRVDLIRHLISPVITAFGCVMFIPKKIPQMDIGILRIPVTQNSIIWRNPQDKAILRKGITEGPVLGLQCRGETNFIRDKHTAVLDTAREFTGLLLLAEERAREGRPPHRPGQGKWYVTKPRWGGGPGGEFGEAEGNTDHAPPNGKKHTRPIAVPGESKQSEEEIWKEMKPGPSLWDPRHLYLAVGKDRSEPSDNVFMISSLFHHMSIVKLTVHPSYIEWLTTGQKPRNTPPGVQWFQPRVQRTRWYDLLIPEDRGEAFRGLWGVMAYQMRSGDNAHTELGQRQKSDSHAHHFSLRRKSMQMTPVDSPPRSSSVAF